MKYQGIAEIELTDINTGKVIKKEEHNELSCLLDDLYSSNQKDGVMSRSFVLSKLFNKLALWDGVISKTGDVIDDNVNLVAAKTATSTTEYGDNGIEMTFEFGTDEANGLIQCVSLVHEDFEDNTTIVKHVDSDIISGSITYKGTDANSENFNIVYIEENNNEIWTIESDSFKNYVKGSPFYIYLKKFYHSYSTIPFTETDIYNMKLLNFVSIDISSIITDTTALNSANFLNYYVDEINKNVIVSFYGKNKAAFNTCMFNLETLDVQMYNMTIPTDITLKLTYNAKYKIEPMPFYNGKCALLASYVDEVGDTVTGMIGINPTNSTDLEIYETVFNSTLSQLKTETLLLGKKNGTCQTSHVFIKNNIAYVIGTNTYQVGFFNKSIIQNYSFDYYRYLVWSYKLDTGIVSTINELSKNLYKTDSQTLKIKYRIIEEDEEDEVQN